MLSNRLVYGCSRLVGGASARTARRLVERCLEGGVRHFDTAPSYGMGTAEGVIGAVVGTMPDVRITAKVGSRRDRHAGLKTGVHAVRRAVAPRATPLGRSHVPVAIARTGMGMNFDPRTMRASLAISRRLLGRERFDLLLLHESYVDDARPEVLAVLTEEQAAGGANVIGYSHGAPFDATTDAAFPRGFVAQTSIRPEWLAGAWPARTRSRYLHSISKVGRALSQTSSDFAAILAEADTAIGSGISDPLTRQLVIIFALAHAGAPDAHLIFSSTDPHRLDAFLTLVGHVERAIDPSLFSTLNQRLSAAA